MTLRTNRKVSHRTSALAAVASVRGYHAWSILDNFEWACPPVFEAMTNDVASLVFLKW
jgi:hypothetical protein